MKMPVLAFLLAIGLLGCEPKQNQSTGIIEPKKEHVVDTTIPERVLQSPTVIETPTPTPKPIPKAFPVKPKGVSGEQIVVNAEKYIGTIEKPGNRGTQIDEWNKIAGVPLGSPYCGSFAGAMHSLSGFSPPKGYAYTPSWFGKNLVTWESAQPGDVIGFYYPSKKRIAHIAILKQYGPTYTKTIEANTSFDAQAGTASDRDGDGVHAKLRNTKILRQERNKVARYW